MHVLGTDGIFCLRTEHISCDLFHTNGLVFQPPPHVSPVLPTSFRKPLENASSWRRQPSPSSKYLYTLFALWFHTSSLSLKPYRKYIRRTLEAETARPEATRPRPIRGAPGGETGKVRRQRHAGGGRQTKFGVVQKRRRGRTQKRQQRSRPRPVRWCTQKLPRNLWRTWSTIDP